MIRSFLLVLSLIAPVINCFAPRLNVSPSKDTALQAARRDVLASVAALSVAATTPLVSLAVQSQEQQQQKQQQGWEDFIDEPSSQVSSSGKKIDLNNSFVVCFVVALYFFLKIENEHQLSHIIPCFPFIRVNIRG